ncbi:hypothetical protein K7X08_003021 [Anisodus acutangulus]|uniref:Uncharacterized protein n=1 Tax=Anisodus acutangulus TaxID=402998 RepID=A0A9Q1MD21_9SOLA|nr:hypothetical protein K7X08_003021 [Anisodus acutangulus]
MTQVEQSNQLQHNPFQVLQKEKPSFTETKKQKDIGEACVDVCYSEQKIESVKAENTPLVGKHPEDLAQSSGKSSVQDPKSAHSLTEIAKQQEMRKPRRRYVVLDADSDFEGEVNNLYTEPQIESADYVPAQALIDPIWRGCFIFNRESETSINILAHLSNKACEKMFKAANGLPVKLDVKIMAKSDVWPKSFLRSPPTDSSIALYLFPEFERDENSYDDLLEDVIDNDLAMKTTIDDLELLIFSSHELPHKHWRLRRKYYLWGVFRRKSSSCSSIPTANSLAQTSSIQNADMSCLLNEVEGANTGSSQGQSFPSPLSILKGVNSGSPQGRFPSSLSSRCNSPESSLNSMERECGRNLDTRNQDVEQHDKYRIQASDIYVSTQRNGLDDEQSLVAPTWFSRNIVSDGMVFTCDEVGNCDMNFQVIADEYLFLLDKDMMGREIFPTGDELSLQRLGMYGTVSSNSVEDNSDDLLSFGVHESDTVVICLSMFVEPPIAKLACARIDAIYSVLLATFSAEFLAQMIMDCKPKTVITFTAVRRESKFNYLKEKY